MTCQPPASKSPSPKSLASLLPTYIYRFGRFLALKGIIALLAYFYLAEGAMYMYQKAMYMYQKAMCGYHIPLIINLAAFRDPKLLARDLPMTYSSLITT